MRCSSLNAKSMGDLSPASVHAGRCAAVDRDTGPLDVARPLACEEDGELGNILGRAEAAQAILGHRACPYFIRRGVEGYGALVEELFDPLRLGEPGQDGIDVHAVAHTDAGQPLAEVGEGRVDGAADQELRVRD